MFFQYERGSQLNKIVSLHIARDSVFYCINKLQTSWDIKIMALTQDHVNQKSKLYIIITHPFNLWLENVIKRNWKYMEPFGMHLLLMYLISCTWRQAQLQITSNFFAKNNYLCLITFAFFLLPHPWFCDKTTRNNMSGN